MALQDKIDLDELIQEILEEKVEEAPRKPIWGLAATQIQFLPAEIREASLHDFGYAMTEEDQQALLEASFQNRKTGRYSLRDFKRKEILNELSARGELAALVDRKQAPAQDENQQLFNAVLIGKSPQLSQLNLSELVMLARIADWLEETTVSIPPRTEINSLIKREELLRPFRKLTENFQGRQKKLDHITQYVDWLPQRTLIGKAQQFLRQTINWFEKPPLLISGIGGIGKSTLIAKFILQHATHDAERKIPFIYLDFDRPGLSISEPMQLAAEGMRQLKVQFPDRAGLFDDIRRDILTYLERGQAGPTRKGPASKASTRGIILEAIHRQYLSRFEEDISRIDSPVLVVLDSFEEAQYRATFSELNNLFQFLQEVAEAVPRFRPVIIGRSDLVVTSFKFDKMYLETFDEQAAQGYLKALGVSDEQLARQIIRKLGGNPLTLQLAAQIVKQDKDSKSEIDSVKTRELFSRIDEKRIQGQLVRRNLDHIHDDEVRKLAVPGMLVRRINPAVIQQVLAVPCGLGEITKDQADLIFERLQKETFLLGESMGSQTFRQDLRVALYDLIVEENWPKAELIHQNAIKYYENAETPTDQAEYLYHRLKYEENPYLIDTFFKDEMRPYLESSLTEFSLAVYMHFATRLGITVAGDVLKNAPARELEAYFNLQIENAIQEGDEEGLQEISKLLLRYPQRTEPSSLLHTEAKLHFRLGNNREVERRLRKIKALWPLDLRSRILEARWYESIREYEQGFKAMEEALEISKKEEIPVTSWEVELQINWFLLRARMDSSGFVPEGNTLSYSMYRNVINQAKLFAKKDDQKENASKFKLDIPRPYRFKNHNLKKPLGGNEQVIEDRDFTKFQDEIFEKLLPGDLFHEFHDRLKNVFSTKGEIEQFLFNRFNLQLSDISEPGTFELNLLDLAKFLEQRDRNEYDDLLEDTTEGTPPDSEFDDAVDKNEDLKASQVTTIKRLIGKDKFQQALDLTQELFEGENAEKKTDLKLLIKRYENNQKDFRLGTVSYDEGIMSHNRNRNDLLFLLEDFSTDSSPTPIMDEKEVIIKVLNLIKKDNLKEAISLSLEIFRNKEDQVISIEGMYNKVQRDSRSGILTYSDENLQIRRIRASLLDLHDFSSNSQTQISRKERDNLIKEVKELIAEANTEQAIERMYILLDGTKFMSTLISLHGHFNKINRDQRLGIVTENDYSIANNHLVFNLIALLNEIQ